VLQQEGTKSMTGKRARRDGRAVAQLFAFLLLPLKNRSNQKQTKQCAARA